MIATPKRFENLEAICVTDGVDSVYIGPADLSLTVEGTYPGPNISEAFQVALQRILQQAPQEDSRHSHA